VQPIDVELVIGSDVLHSYTTYQVPDKGERICVWSGTKEHENKSFKTYLVVDREWHCRQWYAPSVILTVEECIVEESVANAGVVDSVDTPA